MTLVTLAPQPAEAQASSSPSATPATAATASAGGRAALTVQAVSPRRETLARTLSASGGLAAWQEVVIGSETQGLRLVEVAVQVGERVRRGQLLARLQSDTLTAERAATQAALAEAEAVLAQARLEAERDRALQAGGALSAQQLQQTLTAETTARTRVQALKARLQADEVRLAQTRLLAPDDGLISARLATAGAVAQPGQELFRLIRQGRIEWRAELSGADMARLSPGTAVRLTPAGTDTVLEGRVRQIAPTVDPATRQGLVYVDLTPGAAASPVARPGMLARGEFQLGGSEALTLPQGAVLLREGFSIVMRIEADARVREVKVRTGRRVGDRVEILEGLDAQARVVAQGAGFLGDGDRVKVVGTASGAAK
ncbi:MAG: efflux RND transporter periplasmic adaptor subunit [Sphaerotilus natans subsp. sulfidivorans]|uniref:efflux RND transporter periplasmic adaptor subunit n=1 Tax=Sphaerotilus sulfidivorans TaxID=639200 RepID=UPI0023548916|nr:efflux RND transporter periplasmic adaptor subunit [Sphaerotilus sulfidivorans]MCK6400861.1 efflux RND transporter periplasmic adaptor subunit [Sphaerotilus sulfidivorans]